MNNNSLQYKQLREKYPEFIFESYSVAENGSALEIAYNFSMPGLASFCPTWSFSPAHPRQAHIDPECLDRLFFSLGMVELISYWKSWTS